MLKSLREGMYPKLELNLTQVHQTPPMSRLLGSTLPGDPI